MPKTDESGVYTTILLPLDLLAEKPYSPGVSYTCQTDQVEGRSEGLGTPVCWYCNKEVHEEALS